jgi:hypothetical protein
MSSFGLKLGRGPGEVCCALHGLKGIGWANDGIRDAAQAHADFLLAGIDMINLHDIHDAWVKCSRR